MLLLYMTSDVIKDASWTASSKWLLRRLLLCGSASDAIDVGVPWSAFDAAC
jgi:hypothetical protein